MTSDPSFLRASESQGRNRRRLDRRGRTSIVKTANSGQTYAEYAYMHAKKGPPPCAVNQPCRQRESVPCENVWMGILSEALSLDSFEKVGGLLACHLRIVDDDLGALFGSLCHIFSPLQALLLSSSSPRRATPVRVGRNRGRAALQSIPSPIVRPKSVQSWHQLGIKIPF